MLQLLNTFLIAKNWRVGKTVNHIWNTKKFAAAEKLLTVHHVNLAVGSYCLVCQQGWFTIHTVDAFHLNRLWHWGICKKVLWPSAFFAGLAETMLQCDISHDLEYFVYLFLMCENLIQASRVLLPLYGSSRTCTPSSSSSSGGEGGGDFTSTSSLTDDSLFLFESFLAALAPPSDSTFLLL